MSYDLVVCVGERPADADADEWYEQLMEAFEVVENDETPPNPKLVAYAEALLARWPQNADDLGPWVVGPLIADAVGDVFPFGVRFEYANEVVPYAGELAQRHGLVCYDPQEGRLRP